MERDKNASRTFVSNNEKSRVKVVRIDLQQTTDEILAKIVYRVSDAMSSSQSKLLYTCALCSFDGEKRRRGPCWQVRARNEHIYLFMCSLAVQCIEISFWQWQL